MVGRKLASVLVLVLGMALMVVPAVARDFFSEDFETGSIGPAWTDYYASFATSTAQNHTGAGTYSICDNSGQADPTHILSLSLRADYPAADTFEGWFYDNGSNDGNSLASVLGSPLSSSMVTSIVIVRSGGQILGVGPFADGTYKVWRYDGSVSDSSLGARSVGWHRVVFENRYDVVRASLDGGGLSSLSIPGTEWSLINLYDAGDGGSDVTSPDGYFDDFVAKATPIFTEEFTSQSSVEANGWTVWEASPANPMFVQPSHTATGLLCDDPYELLDIPSTDVFPSTTVTQMAVEFWARGQTNGGGAGDGLRHTMIGVQMYGEPGVFSVQKGSDDSIGMWYHDGSTWEGAETAVDFVDSWGPASEHHLMVCWGREGMRVLVDGTLEATNSITATHVPPTNRPFIAGNIYQSNPVDSRSADRMARCTLDDLMVYAQYAAPTETPTDTPEDTPTGSATFTPTQTPTPVPTGNLYHKDFEAPDDNLDDWVLDVVNGSVVSDIMRDGDGCFYTSDNWFSNTGTSGVARTRVTFLDAPAPGGSTFTAQNGEFSYFIRGSSGTNIPGVIFRRQAGSLTDGYWLKTDLRSSEDDFILDKTGGLGYNIATSGLGNVLAHDEWHFIRIVFNGDALKVYCPELQSAPVIDATNTAYLDAGEFGLYCVQGAPSKSGFDQIDISALETSTSTPTNTPLTAVESWELY